MYFINNSSPMYISSFFLHSVGDKCCRLQCKTHVTSNKTKCEKKARDETLSEHLLRNYINTWRVGATFHKGETQVRLHSLDRQRIIWKANCLHECVTLLWKGLVEAFCHWKNEGSFLTSLPKKRFESISFDNIIFLFQVLLLPCAKKI